jgi:hypothetical protein
VLRRTTATAEMPSSVAEHERLTPLRFARRCWYAALHVLAAEGLDRGRTSEHRRAPHGYALLPSYERSLDPSTWWVLQPRRLADCTCSFCRLEQ